MMNPDIKKKWLTALRSGEYEQGKSFLHNDGEFCCLGVLCDIYKNEHPGIEWTLGRDERLVLNVVGDKTPYVLPEAVMHWADVQGPSPLVLYHGVYKQLSMLNDDYGLEFDDLADLIEASL